MHVKIKLPEFKLRLLVCSVSINKNSMRHSQYSKKILQVVLMKLKILMDNTFRTETAGILSETTET